MTCRSVRVQLELEVLGRAFFSVTSRWSRMWHTKLVTCHGVVSGVLASSTLLRTATGTDGMLIESGLRVGAHWHWQAAGPGPGLPVGWKSDTEGSTLPLSPAGRGFPRRQARDGARPT